MIDATLIALAVAAQTPVLNCNNAQAQGEMNECAEDEYRRADAALNAQWMLTVAHMKQKDRDFDVVNDDRPGYQATLVAAQRAWLAYRDRQCDMEGYQMRRSAAEPRIISSCKIRMTEQRVTELKSLASE